MRKSMTSIIFIPSIIIIIITIQEACLIANSCNSTAVTTVETHLPLSQLNLNNSQYRQSDPGNVLKTR